MFEAFMIAWQSYRYRRRVDSSAPFDFDLGRR